MQYRMVRTLRTFKKGTRTVPVWWELTICTDITVQISEEQRTLFICVNSMDHTDSKGRPIGGLVGIYSRIEQYGDPFDVGQTRAGASVVNLSPQNATDLAEILKIAADIAKESVVKNRAIQCTVV